MREEWENRSQKYRRSNPPFWTRFFSSSSSHHRKDKSNSRSFLVLLIFSFGTKCIINRKLQLLELGKEERKKVIEILWVHPLHPQLIDVDSSLVQRWWTFSLAFSLMDLDFCEVRKREGEQKNRRRGREVKRSEKEHHSQSDLFPSENLWSWKEDLRVETNHFTRKFPLLFEEESSLFFLRKNVLSTSFQSQ